MKTLNTSYVIVLSIILAIFSSSAFAVEPEVAYCYGISGDDPDVCSGNGACVDTDYCECVDGSGGSQCELYVCDDGTPDDPDVCSGRGDCTGPLTCDCLPGYIGDYCEIETDAVCFNLHSTDPLACSGHGYCVAPDYCDCDPGYGGAQCDATSCNGYPSSDPAGCSNNGVCVGLDDCQCEDGWGGLNCSEPTSCDDNDQCDTDSYCAKTSCEDIGDCQPKPSGCPTTWDPVCVCDGRTYTNGCYAASAGFNVAYDGECIMSCDDNSQCDADSYCARAGCDDIGTCRPSPLACMNIWDPVCGCDDVTYSNACYAASAGVSVAYEGECQVAPGQCRSNYDCDAVSYCDKLQGDCEGNGDCQPKPLACPVTWDPVCGCDDVTYSNACLAASAGVSVAFEGECQVVPGQCSSNYQCETGSYCVRADGDCNGIGSCQPSPAGCMNRWDSVCGCDGITYTNGCYAANAGVNIAFDGGCIVGATSCSSNDQCDTDSYCAKDSCDDIGTCQEKPRQCITEYEPVCGCDGNTYSNFCYAAKAGMNVAFDGQCQVVPGQCINNYQCGTGSYCAKADCDDIGTCQAKPDLCMNIWDPVCGCDGNTYSNACLAAMSGANVYDDECIIEPTSCDDNSQCETGAYCAKSACDDIGTCQAKPVVCFMVYDPVCGCDGNTYNNDCMAAVAGVNIVHEGQCQEPTTQCYGVDADAPDVCSGNGECVAEDTCQCLSGYEGDDCSVASVIYVDVDIKPGSCPNPLRVNYKGNGVIPVAIMGTEDFDVMDIDLGTIALEGVAPVKSGYDDVSAPSDDDACQCSSRDVDGIEDLVLKFKRKDVLSALEQRLGDLSEFENKVDVAMVLTGTLNGESVEIMGSDCMRILNKGIKKPVKKPKPGKRPKRPKRKR